MAEAVKVVVRCRPMNTREKNLKCQVVVDIDGKIAQCALRNPNDSKAPPKTFTFDGAYGEDSTTEQIYADIGYPLVEGVTEGYNGTIFAYGQTGCGKSFSMQGINDPHTQRGIIPRAFDHIFETIQASDNAKYLVHSSYLEIYNEEIRDLLGKDVKAKLELKEHPDRGVYVQGLSMVPCKNVKECQHIMDRGWKNRSVGATLMNADSSRSHSIFSIHLERCEQDDKGEEHIRAAKLNLVDLAGSERQAKTGSTGERLKEATKINLSLSALGNVISALVDGKSKHIPYRDSKLTRLLQDSLGGNTKTLMVACLSPADNNYDETLSTLRYANRAKNIKNKPKINEDPKDALLREYQEEINKLKMMLRGEIPVQLEGGGAIKPKAPPSKMQPTNEELEIEKQRIREEYEEKMEQMKSEFDKMKLSKEQLEDEMMKLKDQYDNELATIVKPVASPGEEEDKGQCIDEGDPVPMFREQRILAKSTAAKRTKSLQKKTRKLSILEKIHENGTDSPDMSLGSPRSDTGVDGSEDGGYYCDISNSVTVDEQMSAVLHKQQELEIDMQNQLDEIDELKREKELVSSVEKDKVELMSITDSDKASEFYPDPSDAEYLAQPDAQQAVHLNTIRKDVEGILAPRSSPTGIHNAEMLAHDEALRRLEELQQAMVGGEQANNEEVKERIRKKKKYAEERNRKLKEALAQKDGDDIMLDIFDNTQVDLEKQRKALEKQKQKNEALQQEIRDLQSEFEFDRIDYLDTIRKQEQQIKWLQAVIDRIHPCLRRDSNYMNLDKIKMQSQWDEDSQCWILPKMTIEKARLPGVTPGSGRQETHLKQNGEIQPSIYDELRSEDRYLEKLNRNTEQDVAKDYFKSKRAEKLLKNGNDDKYRGNSSSPVGYPMTNGIRQGSASKPPTAWQNDSTSDVHELHAASVHRQPSAEEMMARKPPRLQSLAPTKSGRKKKKQYTIEQL